MVLRGGRRANRNLQCCRKPSVGNNFLQTAADYRGAPSGRMRSAHWMSNQDRAAIARIAGAQFWKRASGPGSLLTSHPDADKAVNSIGFRDRAHRPYRDCQASNPATWMFAEPQIRPGQHQAALRISRPDSKIPRRGRAATRREPAGADGWARAAQCHYPRSRRRCPQ